MGKIVVNKNDLQQGFQSALNNQNDKNMNFEVTLTENDVKIVVELLYRVLSSPVEN